MSAIQRRATRNTTGELSTGLTLTAYLKHIRKGTNKRGTATEDERGQYIRYIGNDYPTHAQFHGLTVDEILSLNPPQDLSRPGKYDSALDDLPPVDPNIIKKRYDEDRPSEYSATFQTRATQKQSSRTAPRASSSFSAKKSATLHLAPPGSGGPFDALNYPVTMRSYLERPEDDETRDGWDEAALTKVPVDILNGLSKRSYEALPATVRQKVDNSSTKAVRSKFADLANTTSARSRRTAAAAAAAAAAAETCKDDSMSRAIINDGRTSTATTAAETVPAETASEPHASAGRKRTAVAAKSNLTLAGSKRKKAVKACVTCVAKHARCTHGENSSNTLFDEPELSTKKRIKLQSSSRRAVIDEPKKNGSTTIQTENTSSPNDVPEAGQGLSNTPPLQIATSDLNLNNSSPLSSLDDTPTTPIQPVLNRALCSPTYTGPILRTQR